MNSRSKPATKKILFEPKVPPVSQNVKPEKPKPAEQPESETVHSVQPIKGTFAPKSFSTNKEFNIDSHEFLMYLPDTVMTSECSLVVFTDGTYGIKCNGQIFECDYSQLDDSILVDIDDKVKKIANPEFVLTAYPHTTNP